MRRRSALAIVNQRSAHLGTLESALRDRGFAIRSLMADADPFEGADADVAVVLGGDMGVYETARHPWIADEVAWLRSRLAADRATLGICLGAQLMAEALGGAGSVRRGPVTDVGFRLVTPHGASPVQNFAGVRVAEWHSDTFDLPEGATLLASSDAYPVEAFSIGWSLAVQFHPEVTPAIWSDWIDEDGGAHEAARADVDLHGPAMALACRAMLDDWLDLVEA